MHENEIARHIVDAAYPIHTKLGPGLPRKPIRAVLDHELTKRCLAFHRQQPIPVVYDGIRLDIGFRADFIVEDNVVIELKAIEAIAPVHKKQVLTYLRLTGKRLGLLINFNSALIKDGITRLVNDLE